MKRHIAALATTLVAILLAACAAPAAFTHTHRGENTGQIDYKGRKVAAVVTGVGVTQAKRIDAENALAKELTARGMQGVAGHSVVPIASSTPMTRERAIELLRQAGVAGVVVLQVVDTEKKTVPTQWASTGYQAALVKRDHFGPIGLEGDTYERRITAVTLETTLFSLEPYALLWAGQSESVNPASIDAFIPQFAGRVGDQLRREGLVK